MPSANAPELQIQAGNGKIFSHVRQKWLEETPEERVRRDARAEVEGMILGTVPV